MMNEERSGAQPKKKRRSLWWLWLLLLLAVYAGGIITGLKINTLPLPTQVRDRLYPMLESYIPGSTQAHDAEIAPAPTVTPAPTPAATVEPELIPVETPEPEETVPAAEPVESPAQETAEAAAPAYIGVNRALEIALREAGAEEGRAEVTGVFRTKDEDGKVVYDVSFKLGETGYNYVIDAVSGEIDSWKLTGLSFADDAVFGAADVADCGLMDEARAEEIALEHAGVKAADVLTISTELKSSEDGDAYNVTFETAADRYKYVIEVATGEILGFEIN